MAEIAFIAGYSSIRRFNDALYQTYGRAPSELRRNKSAAPAESPSVLELKLSYRPPYDWEAMLGFLQARAIPGVEAVGPTRYRRTVRVGDAAGVIEVRPVPEKNHLLLQVPVELARHLRSISERVKQLFDLKASPDAIQAHLCADEMLAPLASAYPGLRLPGAWEPFELGVRAILGQQVSVQAARTLAGRIAATYGEPLRTQDGPQLGVLFPTPERLATADLTGIGLTRSRAETARGFAEAVAEGRLSLRVQMDLNETVRQLVALPGIGPWTAHYIAMRALREPDGFPASDLILRRAMGRNGIALTEAQLLEKAEAWRPWRGYAAILLWTEYGRRQAEQRNTA